MTVQKHNLIKENNFLITSYDREVLSPGTSFIDRLKLYKEITQLRYINQQLSSQLDEEIEVVYVPIGSKINKK